MPLIAEQHNSTVRFSYVPELRYASILKRAEAAAAMAEARASGNPYGAPPAAPVGGLGPVIAFEPVTLPNPTIATGPAPTTLGDHAEMIDVQTGQEIPPSPTDYPTTTLPMVDDGPHNEGEPLPLEPASDAQPLESSSTMKKGRK